MQRIEDLVTRSVFSRTRYIRLRYFSTEWKYPASLYKYSSARGSSRMWGSGKKQLEGKRGKEGWPKIISTNIFVPWRTTGFRRTIRFFFSPSDLSDPFLAIFVSCDAHRRLRCTGSLLITRERGERESWNARANERWLVEFQSRSSGEVLGDSFD